MIENSPLNQILLYRMEQRNASCKPSVNSISVGKEYRVPVIQYFITMHGIINATPRGFFKLCIF